jgi:hypothetical protein
VSKFTDKFKEIAGDIADKSGDLVDKVEEKIPDSVKEKAGVAADKVEELAEKLTDKAGELVGKAKEKLSGDHGEPTGDAPVDTPVATTAAPDAPAAGDTPSPPTEPVDAT